MSKKHTQEDINKLDNYGQTALHLVVNAGTDKEVFDLLLQGANPNITDLEGDTPLHVALNGQNGFVLDVITSLLSFGANPFLTNSEGCSSIHYAATYGNNNQMSIILDISSNFYPAPSDLELLGAVNNE